MTPEDERRFAEAKNEIKDLRERLLQLEEYIVKHRHGLAHDVVLTGNPEPPFEVQR